MPIIKGRRNSVAERFEIKPRNPVSGSTIISNTTIAASDELTTWSGTTSDAVETEIFLDGTTDRLLIASDQVITFKGHANIYNSTDNTAAIYLIEGCFLNNAGTTAQIDYPLVFKSSFDTGMDSTEIKIEADNTNDAVIFKVTGLASKTINWKISGLIIGS